MPNGYRLLPKYNDKKTSYEKTNVDFENIYNKLQDLRKLNTEKERTGYDIQENTIIERNDTSISGKISSDNKLFYIILKFAIWSTAISFIVTVGLIIFNTCLPSDKNISPYIDRLFDITKIFGGAILGLMGGKLTVKE